MKVLVHEVSKKFREDEVLSDISFEAHEGEILGFVGHNGCGKTVLFKCICGFYQVNKGYIALDDEKIGIGDMMPQDIAFTIEEPAFVGEYSGRKNLTLLYELCHRKDEHLITTVMEKVGLDAGSHKPVSKYSLGMKQRLAIAQVLMEDKPVMIFDEPMNGLDRAGIEEIRRLILEEKEKGKTILMASHNSQDIALLCDRIYHMENGRFV